MNQPLRCALFVALTLGMLFAALARAETADEFVARLNREITELAVEVNAAGWTQATYINVDTQLARSSRDNIGQMRMRDVNDIIDRKR